jgi:hypothetical protein
MIAFYWFWPVGVCTLVLATPFYFIYFYDYSVFIISYVYISKVFIYGALLSEYWLNVSF